MLPQVMLPVNNGFSAIQKSVFECAMAGCKTIWIVANNDLAPVVRKHIGDWVYDPVYYERTFTKFYSDHRREIPIYYVPIHPKDRDRRDSYGWSILYGVYSSWYTAYKISKWITPQNYYVSFPMSIYDVYAIREYRQNISKELNDLLESLLSIDSNNRITWSDFFEHEWLSYNKIKFSRKYNNIWAYNNYYDKNNK